MQFKPYAYQTHAIERVVSQPNVGLFLECGLGKSVITLSAINEMLYLDVAKVLVIAPLRVAETTWTDEIKKWDHLRHLRIAKVLGNQANRLEALKADADIWVINRENVSWLVNHYGAKWPFDMVIIDELSSFKSSKSQRFRALRKVRPFIERIVGLTGTPAPNGLLDLWPQLYLLDRGERLGRTLSAYRERYFVPGKRNQVTIFSWEPKPFADEVIQAKISDICISMASKDWMDLPERIDRKVQVKMPEKAYKQYRKLEKDWLLPLVDGDITAGNSAVVGGKLLQLANGAVYDEHQQVKVIHNSKLDALMDIIEALNSKPVLVFYTYKHDLLRVQEKVRKQYPKLNVKPLKGAEDIDAWNQVRIHVLLAHPASAGHGLNLQSGGSTIVWFGLPWSLELYQQGNARLHRQGQKENVIVHHLIAKGTIDEQVM